jgi:hypothetical protein
MSMGSQMDTASEKEYGCSSVREEQKMKNFLLSNQLSLNFR